MMIVLSEFGEFTYVVLPSEDALIEAMICTSGEMAITLRLPREVIPRGYHEIRADLRSIPRIYVRIVILSILGMAVICNLLEYFIDQN